MTKQTKPIMNFTITQTAKYNVFNIEEKKLTAEFAPSFKAELILQADHKKSIICNLENVDYVDSSGLSCLLIGDRLFKENKCQFIVCHASEKALNLIKLTKLETVLTVIPTIQEAKDFILFDELQKDL